MKKQFLFAMAAVAMLASCSNDDVVSNNGIDGDKGRIEVKLGQPSIVSSRASINNDAGWKNNAQIGIFAINRKAADWTVTTDPKDRLIYNETTKVDAAGTDLSWVAAGKHFYYPYDNKYEYSFYGYHPVQAEANIKATATQVTCDFTLNGTQDILWGKNVLPIDTKGFNYKYITDNPATPSVPFQHLLTRFQFFVTGTTGAIAKDLAVTKVEVLNVQTAAQLVIADKADTEIAAVRTLTLTGAADQILTLKDAAGTDATKVKATAGAGSPMGESIMLPAGATSYDLRITFRDFAEATAPITVLAKLTKAGNVAFLAGQSHKVIITLTEPKEVSLKATLADWDMAGEDIKPM
ncbi:MAG: fimbrillin family protein [Bacteroides sp.]